MLGFFISVAILFFIFLGIVASIASFANKEEVVVKNNTILHVQLTEEIVDRTPNNPMENFNFSSFKPEMAIGLNDILGNLKKAASDEKISGIFLDLSSIRSGISTLAEIRNGIKEFKKSGKFVVAYAEYYSQGSYYLASIADQVFMNPVGSLDFRGINSEIMFYKNMLEKLGIEVQIIRHGKFKSAGEAFFLDKMSDENKEQTLAFIGAIWNSIIKDISESRSIAANQLNEYADKYASRRPEKALELNFIDGIRHRDEVINLLKEKTSTPEGSDPNLLSINKYSKAKNTIDKKPRSRNKIAVVYASGEITSGEGSDRIIGSARIAEAIHQARCDSSVKAIVLRVNSPGGSALASDVILREIILAKQSKPVVASMGDVAASGGYYISCMADKIIASPTTITGSIGVFGLIPNMKGFFNSKIGITFDNVKTNEMADFSSISRPLTPTEKLMIQDEIDIIYTTFITHVSNGRNLTIDQVDEIAQGRVWSGTEAKQIGLIDDFGGLTDAIQVAVDLAKLDNYRIEEFPKRKDFFQQFMEDLGGNAETAIIKRKLGNYYDIYMKAEAIKNQTGIQARMPFDIILN